MPSISLVIPAYKAERTLERCLNSAVGQSLGDIEILVVNDGSPDGSGEIADDFARRDARVRVMHQKNAGVSVARNRGMAEARGEFVQFLDSDDFLLPGYCERLLAAADDRVDVVLGGFDNRVLDEHGLVPSRIMRPPFTGRRGGADLLRIQYATSGIERYTFPMPFNKLYRREVAVRHGVAFPPGMHSHEDLCFNISFAGRCRDVVAVDECGYVYVTDAAPNGTQAMQQYNARDVDDMLEACSRLQDAFALQIGDAEPAERNRACASMLISAVVRLCRADATISDADIRATLRKTFARPEAQAYFRDYLPAAGQSRLIPLFMRLNWPRPLLWAARRRAIGHYGRVFRNILGRNGKRR